MPYCKTSTNLKLHYELRGSGSVKILYIMGINGTLNSWHFQSMHFANERYQICLFDNRGVGFSELGKNERMTTKQMAI
ncbi:hypothetical protein HK099_004620, partial [Clydaea vesicula]